MKAPTVHRFASQEEAAEALAAWTARLLSAAAAQRGRALAALPGGSTPRRFLTALAGKDAPWDRVTVMPTDERCVPADHPRSNEGMIRAAFTPPIGEGGCRFLSMTGEWSSAEAQAIRAAATVRAAGRIDLCVCGMGEDMHTASLFPRDFAWTEGLSRNGSWRGPDVVLAEPPGLEPRLSLSPGVLTAARQTALLIHGPAKVAALTRALREKDATLAPVQFLFHPAGSCTIFLSI